MGGPSGHGGLWSEAGQYSDAGKAPGIRQPVSEAASSPGVPRDWTTSPTYSVPQFLDLQKEFK